MAGGVSQGRGSDFDYDAHIHSSILSVLYYNKEAAEKIDGKFMVFPHLCRENCIDGRKYLQAIDFNTMKC